MTAPTDSSSAPAPAPTQPIPEGEAPITLTSWAHSCVSIDEGDTRLVIDPGGFSDLSVLAQARAILVTHAHPDHIAIEPVAAALTESETLEIWAPQGAVNQLIAQGAPAHRCHTVTPGETFTAAGHRIATFGGEHHEIHPHIAGITNIAYLVDGVVLHPGDSFAALPAQLAATVPSTGISVLLLPISAPWLRLASAADYALELTPRVTVPIHDAILSDIGKGLTDRVFAMIAPDLTYRRLTIGEASIL